MGLNDTPAANRIHIGIFGRRNAGKSSLINAITGQQVSLVSDTPGTTTDPVKKAMEILPLGPVLLIDSPGLDDSGELGAKRVQAGLKILETIDIGILVVDSAIGMGELENNLEKQLISRNIPYITVFNKCDKENKKEPTTGSIAVSALTGENIDILKNRLAGLKPAGAEYAPIVGDLIQKSNIVVLVTPIDSAAPKGRMILPQQQTIRDILDSGGICMVTKDTELVQTLESLKNPPKMVITDSQAFEQVSKDTPLEIPLTSFSILFARRKGVLNQTLEGLKAIDSLKDGDKVLISEGCSHHRQCDDIGTVKIPMWLKKYTGKNISFEFSSGNDFPVDLKSFALVVHCGGCMLTDKVMQRRLVTASEQSIPMTNYGMLIAKMKGILDRSVEMFR